MAGKHRRLILNLLEAGCDTAARTAAALVSELPMRFAAAKSIAENRTFQTVRDNVGEILGRAGVDYDQVVAPYRELLSATWLAIGGSSPTNVEGWTVLEVALAMIRSRSVDGYRSEMVAAAVDLDMELGNDGSIVGAYEARVLYKTRGQI